MFAWLRQKPDRESVTADSLYLNTVSFPAFFPVSGKLNKGWQSKKRIILAGSCFKKYFAQI